MSPNEIFTRLMGDVVEPRREFIQDNALERCQSRRLIFTKGERLAKRIDQSRAPLTGRSLLVLAELRQSCGSTTPLRRLADSPAFR